MCTPNSAAPLTVRNTSAVCSSSLAGMHPRFKQVPAEALLLDDRDVHSGRRAVERRRVTAGTASQHDQIEIFGQRADLSRFQLRTSCTANAARITKTRESRENDVRARAHQPRLPISWGLYLGR